jgi:hypothetical protein
MVNGLSGVARRAKLDSMLDVHYLLLLVVRRNPERPSGSPKGEDSSILTNNDLCFFWYLVIGHLVLKNNGSAGVPLL